MDHSPENNDVTVNIQ